MKSENIDSLSIQALTKALEDINIELDSEGIPEGLERENELHNRYNRMRQRYLDSIQKPARVEFAKTHNLTDIKGRLVSNDVRPRPEAFDKEMEEFAKKNNYTYFNGRLNMQKIGCPLITHKEFSIVRKKVLDIARKYPPPFGFHLSKTNDIAMTQIDAEIEFHILKYDSKCKQKSIRNNISRQSQNEIAKLKKQLSNCRKKLKELLKTE